ncbi:MAG: ATP-binding protein [Muribaculaceae bacterium]|nr:ATP-binding protein [Muribaculaceae bacterium]
MNKLIYPIGEQDFPKIRERNMVYVDKTALIHRLVNEAGYVFLSRPRRFGKSLLISTLEAYFSGRKELFAGLAMEKLETEWTQYPVLKLDMSRGKYARLEYLHSALNDMFDEYERKYGTTPPAGASYGTRLKRIIDAAYEQTGQRVVALVDEYDAPMLDCLDDPERLDVVRDIMRDLYSPLKAQAARLRFVFLTGITKFSQMSIFSELNNLTNISMQPEYDALCGISAEEMVTQMRQGVEDLAEYHHCTFDEMVALLKANYDGYRFSHRMTEIYNPFSLVKIFQYKELENYWFESGTPTWLFSLLKKYDMLLPDMERVEATSDRFNRPAETITDVVPVLYQSGSLTIKDYNRDIELYTLGFPNKEVRTGFGRSFMNYLEPVPNQRIYMQKAYHMLAHTGDMTDFMASLHDFYAAIPYDIANDNERHYQAILYAVLASYGADVCAEDHTSDGRADIVLRMPQAIYVMELKYGQSAAVAMEQLHHKNYGAKYAHDGRPVRLLGLNISKETRTVDDWQCE